MGKGRSREWIFEDAVILDCLGTISKALRSIQVVVESNRKFYSGSQVHQGLDSQMLEKKVGSLVERSSQDFEF